VGASVGLTQGIAGVTIVEETRHGVEQEHVADQAVRVPVDVTLESEAHVYCRRRISASKLSDGGRG
jgi:hypothetical protein